MARAAAVRERPRRAAPPLRKPLRRVSGPVTRRPAARGVAVPPAGARVLDALLTGRAWIALVGVLLAGIVFFNVDLLQMNRDITRMAERAAELKRDNARIRLDVARLASSERIQEAAAQQGLVLPAPAEVRYLKSNPDIDARTASKRIIPPDGTYVAPTPVTSEPITPTTEQTTLTTTTPPNTTTTPPNTTTPPVSTPTATGAVE